MLNSEVLVNSARIRDLIASGRPQSELDLAIREGDYYGMRSFDQCLLSKVRDGSIARAEALAFATRPARLQADDGRRPRAGGRRGRGREADPAPAGVPDAQA